MKTRKTTVLFIIVGIGIALPSPAQDTTKRAVTLPAVNIVQPGEKPSAALAQTPTQTLTTAACEAVGDAMLSDAVRHLAGVTLKDYGGVGGVKTVSTRGLGSQFSTLVIDGVPVNDCQNGQVDLGRYPLCGTGEIVLANGQEDNMLQSARAYAAGSTLGMTTAKPLYPWGCKSHLKIRLDGGSFGYLAPSISFDRKWGRRGNLMFSASHTRSKGNYPFTLYYTRSHADSSSIERRENSQMHLTTMSADYFLDISPNRRLHMKAHYINGFHALPGPVVYYASKGSEHSEEQLFFTQANYHKKGEHCDVMLLGKYQRGNDIYEDTAARTASGIIHNEYTQQEAYLSQCIRYHVFDNRLSVSLSADEVLSQLQSNLSQHNNVERRSALGVLAAEYAPTCWNRGLRLQAHLLGTWVHDHEAGLATTPYTKLSPYFGVTYSGNFADASKHRFTFRYFFKDTYRVPNFNELYYFTVGRSLQPEKARQHNLGLSIEKPADKSQSYDIGLNGYYNQVSNKIIAIPTQNMFLWSMANLGKVGILGADLTGRYNYDRFGADAAAIFTEISIQASYSYQRALDLTDPESKTYRNQIPYTPRHSGNVTLTASTKWVDLGYTLALVGKRYSMQQNTEACRLESYADHSINLSRDFQTKSWMITVKAQVLNLLNVQYEVVMNYPMMGRNYRLGITLSPLTKQPNEPVFSTEE